MVAIFWSSFHHHSVHWNDKFLLINTILCLFQGTESLDDSIIYVGTSMANASLNDSVVYVGTFKQEKNDDSVVILHADFPKKEEPNESTCSASYSADKSSSDCSSLGSPPDYTPQLLDLYKRRSTLLTQNDEGSYVHVHEMSSGRDYFYNKSLKFKPGAVFYEISFELKISSRTWKHTAQDIFFSH